MRLPRPLQTGTDYGPFLANEPSPMHTTTLVDCCTRKLVADWRYLRENVRQQGRAGQGAGRHASHASRLLPPGWLGGLAGELGGSEWAGERLGAGKDGVLAASRALHQ